MRKRNKRRLKKLNRKGSDKKQRRKPNVYVLKRRSVKLRRLKKPKD